MTSGAKSRTVAALPGLSFLNPSTTAALYRSSNSHSSSIAEISPSADMTIVLRTSIHAWGWACTLNDANIRISTRNRLVNVFQPLFQVRANFQTTANRLRRQYQRQTVFNSLRGEF